MAIELTEQLQTLCTQLDRVETDLVHSARPSENVPCHVCALSPAVKLWC